MSWNETLNECWRRPRITEERGRSRQPRPRKNSSRRFSSRSITRNELQATLAQHATESGQLAAEQSQAMLGHLSEYVKIGRNRQFTRRAEQARATAVQMADEAQEGRRRSLGRDRKKPE